MASISGKAAAAVCVCRRKTYISDNDDEVALPTFVGISAIGAFDDDAFPKATHTQARRERVRLTQLTMDFPLFATAESAVHRFLLGIYTLLTTM